MNEEAQDQRQPVGGDTCLSLVTCGPQLEVALNGRCQSFDLVGASRGRGAALDPRPGRRGSFD